jgi:hypothetical protein
MSSSRYTVVHALGSLALVMAFVLGASARRRDAWADAQRRAVRAVAARTGASAASLRTSMRTDLGTRHYYMVRVRGAAGDATERTVAVAIETSEVLLAGELGTLARVMRDERAEVRIGELGAFRVASWIGALGDGTCGAPASPRDVTWRPLDHAGVELRFAFVRADQGGRAHRAQCVVRLGADGPSIEVHASPVADQPTARAS